MESEHLSSTSSSAGRLSSTSMGVNQKYISLIDYLARTQLHLNGELNDGGGTAFSMKGREIDATIMFADISGFSARTLSLTSTETLAFVNTFFAWVTAEALQAGPGIVDKYIGDEVMVIFSKEFGSEDPFQDAVRAAFRMGANDVHAYQPSVGIASGRVTVGVVGSELNHGVSVFGGAVAMASRCAGVKLRADDDTSVSSGMTFPSIERAEHDLDVILLPRRYPQRDGSVVTQPHGWELTDTREVPMKNLPDQPIRQIVNTGHWFPMQSADDRAREGIAALRKSNDYRPSAV